MDVLCNLDSNFVGNRTRSTKQASKSGVNNVVPAGARSPARTTWVDRGPVLTKASI